MSRRGLSEEDKIFVLAWLRTQSPKRAAVIAGRDEKNAAVWGNRRLKAKVVQDYIAKIKDKFGEACELDDIKSSELTKEIMSLEEALAILSRIARREEKESAVVTVKVCKSYYNDGHKVTETTEEPHIVEYKAKLSDVIKAIDLILKFHDNGENNSDESKSSCVVILPEVEIRGDTDVK